MRSVAGCDSFLLTILETAALEFSDRIKLWGSQETMTSPTGFLNGSVHARTIDSWKLQQDLANDVEPIADRNHCTDPLRRTHTSISAPRYVQDAAHSVGERTRHTGKARGTILARQRGTAMSTSAGESQPQPPSTLLRADTDQLLDEPEDNAQDANTAATERDAAGTQFVDRNRHNMNTSPAFVKPTAAAVTPIMSKQRSDTSRASHAEQDLPGISVPSIAHPALFTEIPEVRNELKSLQSSFSTDTLANLDGPVRPAHHFDRQTHTSTHAARTRLERPLAPRRSTGLGASYPYKFMETRRALCSFEDRIVRCGHGGTEGRRSGRSSLLVVATHSCALETSIGGTSQSGVRCAVEHP